MSSSGKEVQNINNSILTQSQSHLQKEKEARRDAEDRIRSFNYAKSIGGINSAAGKEGDEIKPLSSLAQGYLRSIAGNNRDELDDNGDGGGDGAGAGPSASNDSVQGQTIDIMPDMSVRDNAVAVEVDNMAASMEAKSETKNDIEGDEIHVPIEGERTDIAAAKDQHKDLPSSSIDDDETNAAMIHEDNSAGSDNDVGEVVASSDLAALDDGDVSSERREDEGGGCDEDGKDSIIVLGIAEVSAVADAGATTTIHESEVPSKDRTEGDDKATSLDDSSDVFSSIRNEDNIEETNNGNIDNSEGDIAADVEVEVDNTPTPNTEDDETHDAIEDERENNGISAEDQHKDLPLSNIDDDESTPDMIHEDLNTGSDNDVGEVDASSDLAALDDGDVSSERRDEEDGGGGDEDGKDSIILLGAAAAADAGATAIDESEVPSTDRTEGDEKATSLDDSSDVSQSIPENEAVPNSDFIEEIDNDNLDRSVRDNAAAVEVEVDNTPASMVEEFTTSQLPNDTDDAEIHETIEAESASISAETDYKDLPPSNIDNDESNPAMIHADYSAGSDNEEGEVDSYSVALNDVASSKRDDERDDEEGSKSDKMLVAAKEAEVAGGAAVASTTIDGREVPSNHNEGVENVTSLGSSKDVFQSIPENEAIHSYDNFDETNNNIMSTTCIDGEEELDEDEDEDQTEYCGSLAGTIATGALARRTNEFSDQSDHAVIDEESQGTGTPPTPQDNDAPPAQSPHSDDLSDGGEIIGRPTKRWKWLLILSALAIALAVVAGMGVGVDRGLNHIDNASILIIPVPTQSPTSGPSLSLMPSDLPSSLPSSKPSAEPSAPPSISAVPSISPTVTFPPTISAAPSSEPSQQPSLSTQPSSKPSTAPSISAQPTGSPSESPTLSSQPSAEPTSSPSLSSAPSAAPSTSPTISTMPSASPSASPTNLPSATPSSSPTSFPSSPPSESGQPSSMPSLEIEPFRTMLKRASPKSAERLHRERAYQYQVMMWVYYETDYDNYTDEERLQLWALGCFFEATLGVHWDDNTNWMMISHNTTACDWYGLTCNERGMVTRIELGQNNVQRNIPVEFKVLPSLQYLGLAENSIGRLDPILFEMYTLEVIDLDGNGIEKIPEEIPIRNQVKELYLAGNRIKEIPESILMLSKLEVLWLWTNLLEDTIPEFMSRMSNLIELDLEDNFLSGDLWPAAEMQSLQHLYVFDNIMGGEITSGLIGGNTTYAEGDLSSSPVLKCSMLKSLDMSTNYWYGTIPTNLTNMVNMEELYLEDNELSGIIPPEIFNLGNLHSLFLGMNYLSSVIPSEIGNARSLKKFYAENNYREMDSGRLISKGIYGQLPATMLNLQQLEELVLDNNYVEGTLMTELGTLENLTRLKLVLNMLEGPIPSSIQNLKKLKDLQLWGNYMTGYLPNNLSFELERLQLHDNSFSGTIPTEWGRCRNLTILDVSYNDLTGPIPTEFGNLRNLTDFYTEYNVLYGFMPEEVCLLRSESLDELSANCDVPRENTLRPTRSPTRRPTLQPTWGQGWVRHYRNLQKEQPTELLITSSPSEYPATNLLTGNPSLLPSLPGSLRTKSPSGSPSLFPSIQVPIESIITSNPTSNPSDSPVTYFPADTPSLLPSSSHPTEPGPTQTPTFPPSFTPSIAASQLPSSNPSKSMRPTSSPTFHPTFSHRPSVAPTRSPSMRPTNSPTESPTFTPSAHPTKTPTTSPTDKPSVSIIPSAAPTVEYFWKCTCCTYCRIDAEIHSTMKPTRRPTPRPTASPSPTLIERPTRPSSSWWNKRMNVNELT